MKLEEARGLVRVLWKSLTAQKVNFTYTVKKELD